MEGGECLAKVAAVWSGGVGGAGPDVGLAARARYYGKLDHDTTVLWVAASTESSLAESMWHWVLHMRHLFSRRVSNCLEWVTESASENRLLSEGHQLDCADSPPVSP